jgi:glycosyltransferase involved in cell wall biosynthesis
MFATHNQKSFYIVGLKYAPGMWQHIASFARNLQQRGYPVRLLLSPGYHWMNTEFGENTHYSFSPDSRRSFYSTARAYGWLPWSRFRQLFIQEPPAGLLLVSWHPMNFLLLRLVKSLYPLAPTMVWLHEPFKDDKKIYGAKAGIIYLVELFQTLSLRYLDVVILHSHRAQRLFQQRYPKFSGETHLIPLPFQDDGPGTGDGRRYISFLGRADRAKGIDLFFALLDGFARRDMKVDFQIVTASNIDKQLHGLTPAARQNLKVVNRPRLSDQDLRQAAGQSLAVLALYKETMQSGVIPVAWMKGAPVIGTDIEGITEWVRDQETGVIVSPRPTIDELTGAIDYIRRHFTHMTPHCRAAYLATFDDSNWDRQYGWLRPLLAGGMEVSAGRVLMNSNTGAAARTNTSEGTG